ncbi:cyclophilin-like domain-containing protein [Geopyxis carbonaria]|nr:cyclophilin-like domain-containing protein [Geopyxis carbonaria]
MVRPRVFMDIQIGAAPAGRIVIELFSDKTPQTCENFLLLCTGTAGSIDLPHRTSPVPLHYANTPIHRVVPEFMIQGGDITRGDGTGGACALGRKYVPDENLGWRRLDAAGLVCMANRGPDTGSSQFFITLDDAGADALTAKHTCFGRVVTGMETVARIAELEVDAADRPRLEVRIAACGQLEFRRKQAGGTAKGGKSGAEKDGAEKKDDEEKDGGKDKKRDARRDADDRSPRKRRDSSPRSHRRRDASPHRSRHHHRSRRASPSPARSPAVDAAEPTPADAAARGRSPSPSTRRRPHRSHRSRSRSPRRRRYRSRSPRRPRQHRRSRSPAEYIRDDDDAEERMRREEMEREGARGAMVSPPPAEGAVKFKGRGSMKYRERKNWGSGGGYGRLD